MGAQKETQRRRWKQGEVLLRLKKFIALIVVVVLSCCLSGCEPSVQPRPPAPPAWRPVGVTTLIKRLAPAKQGKTSWRDYEPAIRRSLKYVRKKPATGVAVQRPGLTLQWRQLALTLEKLLALLPELDNDPGLLEKHFTWAPVTPNVLLTGYYEPLFSASKTKTPTHPYPLYTKPGDVKKGTPYKHDRAAIDFGNALQGRGLEIAWAKSLVDVFFLQIQGSGRLSFPNGETKYILYNGSNGHPYVSLGKALIERGFSTKEEMSMQKIRQVLEEHPDKQAELLSLNPKYIFFRLGDKGPYGAFGEVLTPRVSVAVDRKYIPLGALLAVDAKLPGYQSDVEEQFSGLMLAQDTGTMHENHLDLFCGAGDKAEFQAGNMKGRATAYLLLSLDALTAQ